MRTLWAIVLLVPLATALQPATALAVRATADRADDITGYQVHFMYVLPSNGVDEGLDTDGTLARSIEAFQRWLAGQTNGPRLRADTYDYYGHSIPGCLDLGQSVFLEPSVVGAVAPPRWPSVYLPDSGCDREGTIRSVSANSRVSLNFVNGTPQQLRVYWLDYNGQRQPFGTVEAWQTRGQGTFVTHPWVITDLNGQCVALFATETLNGTAADAVVKAVVRPTVTRVTLSGSQLSPGTHLTIGIEAHHLGAGTLDLFVGILLADGRTVVFFSSPGTVGGVVDVATQPLSALQRMTLASNGFSTSMPDFLNFTLPATGIPFGSYMVFALFLVPDALTDSALSADEIAAVDTKVITILP